MGAGIYRGPSRAAWRRHMEMVEIAVCFVVSRAAQDCTWGLRRQHSALARHLNEGRTPVLPDEGRGSVSSDRDPGLAVLLAALQTLRIPDLDLSSTGQMGRDDDEDGYSIPAQLAANKRKAEELGAQLAGAYVERAESARSDDRPVLQQMLKELPTLGVQYLIVHKVDRLAQSA
jgi:hypothetical protein